MAIDAHRRRCIAHRLGERDEGGEALVALDVLGNSVELGERFGLMEVLPDAADIALDFRILVGFDDERAEEMADQLIAQSATLLEQAEV